MAQNRRKNSLSYLPLPRHPLLHACLCRLWKRPVAPKRGLPDRVQNIYNTQIWYPEINVITGIQLLTAEELRTELPTKCALVTGQSCCEMLHCSVSACHAVFSFHSTPAQFIFRTFVPAKLFCAHNFFFLLCSPLNSSFLAFWIILIIVSD